MEQIYFRFKNYINLQLKFYDLKEYCSGTYLFEFNGLYWIFKNNGIDGVIRVVKARFWQVLIWSSVRKIIHLKYWSL